MIYSKCPTCGFFIGNISDSFEKKKEEICSNTNLSEEEQEKQISEVLKNLKIRRYCCRMRIMSSKDMVFEIVAPRK
tara:strand:- start:275 stop:502 length:228 start_codon:yes stop_codon:yes gene_type:complete